AKPHPLSGVEAGGGDQAPSPRRQAQDAGAVKLTSKDWLGAAIALVVAALFVSAGVWQLNRLHQRRARNADVRARRALPAVAVTAFVIQALPSGSPTVRPSDLVSWPAPELSDGPHLSYAIQWFAFAGIVLVGMGAILKRNVEERRGGTT